MSCDVQIGCIFKNDEHYVTNFDFAKWLSNLASFNFKSFLPIYQFRFIKIISAVNKNTKHQKVDDFL